MDEKSVELTFKVVVTGIAFFVPLSYGLGIILSGLIAGVVWWLVTKYESREVKA